jgi:protein-S-isoprenylcysteine O-methyltransferase Ste14
VISGIIAACVFAIFFAVMADFLLYNRRGGERIGRRSIVATGSMAAFFAGYYLVLYSGVGHVAAISRVNMVALVIAGTAMIVAGAAVNVWGRLMLRGNWANHIKIYGDHELVSGGPYRIVRQPLYASIILMLIGGSFVYRDWLALLLTLLVFTPFMAYRARQEEVLLEQEVNGYADYMKRTGMLFPRLRR